MTAHIQTIYTEEKTAFAASINPWLEAKGFLVEPFEENEETKEKIDAVVIFHDNHNFDKRTSELRDLFELLQAPIHKIDLSGTMNVALSHLGLFFDRTKCKHVLFIASEAMKDHPKMDVFKEKWDF